MGMAAQILNPPNILDYAQNALACLTCNTLRGRGNYQLCCRSVKLDDKQKMFYGIICASLSGAIGSLFSPGFNVVTNDAFHNLDPGVKPLSVYTG